MSVKVLHLRRIILFFYPLQFFFKVASMAQMNSMPSEPAANVNTSVIDDKIKDMLHMNETKLNGELYTLF